MKENIIKLKKTGKFIFILVAFFLIIYVLQIFKPVIYKQMDKFKLIPQKEHFTELYLNNQSEIIKYRDAERSKKPLSFSFTIHNLEGKNMEYSYQVYSVSGDNKTIIDEKTVSVLDGDSKIISQTYTPISSIPLTKETIFIELPQSKQLIHFSITNNN